ncbi:MAG: (2Fe-2S)-binding protein [Alphaproteobacteria bacterium]|nr:(2Fe-2S)-binding protein [Alphaproteobacteria bacterium]
MTAITIDLNGVRIADDVEPRQSLADFLRERCGLTATHLGCEHGACGACTVVVDGKATRSCLSLAVMSDGRVVLTLEGLRNDQIMDILRRQFHECHALQCGFCTPGMLIMARDILQRHQSPDANTVRHELSGQICRCTGYANIVKAVVAAGKDLAAAQAHALAGALAEAEALIQAEVQARVDDQVRAQEDAPPKPGTE